MVAQEPSLDMLRRYGVIRFVFAGASRGGASAHPYVWEQTDTQYWEIQQMLHNDPAWLAFARRLPLARKRSRPDLHMVIANRAKR